MKAFGGTPTSTGHPLRLLVVAVTCVIAALLGVTGTAGTAQAATQTAHATVTACFQSSYLGVYGAFGGRPVSIDYYDSSSRTWYVGGSDYTALNGCITRALPVGWYWRYRVYTRVGQITYVGQSNYVWPVAGGSAYLGTFRLSQY